MAHRLCEHSQRLQELLQLEPHIGPECLLELFAPQKFCGRPLDRVGILDALAQPDSS